MPAWSAIVEILVKFILIIFFWLLFFYGITLPKCHVFLGTVPPKKHSKKRINHNNTHYFFFDFKRFVKYLLEASCSVDYLILIIRSYLFLGFSRVRKPVF